MSDPESSNRAENGARVQIEHGTGTPSGRSSAHFSFRILTFAVMVIGSACATDRGRPGTESPTEPTRPDVAEISGNYEAVRILVERSGETVDLVGDPDTRISLQLNADGSAQGQLKFGADLELRTKLALVGRWRFSVPNLVFFDFSEETFLDETGFRVQLPSLTGSWQGEHLRIDLELQRTTAPGPTATRATARR